MRHTGQGRAGQGAYSHGNQATGQQAVLSSPLAPLMPPLWVPTLPPLFPHSRPYSPQGQATTLVYMLLPRLAHCLLQLWGP